MLLSDRFQIHNGFQYEYDKFASGVTGQPSHVREYIEWWANWALNESDKAKQMKAGAIADTRHAWGHCDATAKFASAETRPITARTRRERIIKLGMKAAEHEGDISFRPSLDLQTNINFFLDQLVNTGTPCVVDLPEKPGQWFRVLYGVNAARTQVLVTNFGYGDKWMPRNGIKDAHFGVAFQDSASLQAMSEVPDIVDELKWWRYTSPPQEPANPFKENSGINPQFVNAYVYGDPLG